MSHQTFRIEFNAEHCPSYHACRCRKCEIYFDFREIRIFVKSRAAYYHLYCYSNERPQYIRKSDLNIFLDSQSMQIIDYWLNAWNANFFPLDRTPITFIPQKNLPTFSVTRKRVLIEIFKFLPVSCVTSALSLVCKQFYEVCWDKELWQFFLLRDFNINLRPESKTKYIELFSTICIECKTDPSEETYYRCPFLKKTICKNCLITEKFVLMSRSNILKAFGIDPKVLNLEFVRSMTNVLVTYLFKAKNEVYKMREYYKERILKMSQVFGDDHEFVQLIKNINVTKLDSMQIFPLNISSNIYSECFDKSINWKLYIDIQKAIRIGKIKFTKERLKRKVKKRYSTKF